MTGGRGQPGPYLRACCPKLRVDGASRSRSWLVLDFAMVFEAVVARLCALKWVFSGDRVDFPRPSSGTRRSIGDVVPARSGKQR